MNNKKIGVNAVNHGCVAFVIMSAMAPQEAGAVEELRLQEAEIFQAALAMDFAAVDGDG